MCLIAYRPDPSKHISEDIIEHNLRSNPDGFGLTWQSFAGVRKTRKFAPKQAKEFAHLLRQIDKTGAVYVAHWRFATHGEKSLEMSHPFTYDDASGREVIAFHNGIINIATQGKESDTLAFVNRVLRYLPSGWWNDRFIREMVEDAIGWSRMLFWTDKGIVRINSTGWEEHDGLMYSCSPLPSYTKYKWQTVNAKDSLLLPESVADVVVDPKTGKDVTVYDIGPSTKEKDHKPVHYTHEGHTVVTNDRWVANDQSEPIQASGSLDCLTCGETGEYCEVDGVTYTEFDHTRPKYLNSRSKEYAAMYDSDWD